MFAADIAEMESILEESRAKYRETTRKASRRRYLEDHHLLEARTWTRDNPTVVLKLGDTKKLGHPTRLRIPTPVYQWLLGLGGVEFVRDLLTVKSGGKSLTDLARSRLWPDNVRNLLVDAYEKRTR
jgi:hypothetical protein